MESLLSIIVPVYNAQEWICETLDSLCTQNYQNIEILCIDDGSRDNSAKIVKEYQNKDNRVRLIQQENAGVSAARNHGIDQARGEYIAFLDADDYVDPTVYEKMIALLEKEKSDISFCGFVRFWPNGKKQYAIETNLKKLAQNPHDIKYFLYSSQSEVKGDTLYTPDIHGSSCRSVFKTSIIKENHVAFHSDLKFAEDQIFVLEYLQYCTTGSYLSENLIWYRGWTKPWTYHCMFDNMMNLCKYQRKILENNSFYSSKEKRQLTGYCRYSTFLTIINEEFMFKPDAHIALKEYYKNKDFARLNSFYNFWQKQKQKKDIKRIVLFLLLKFRLFGLVKKFYPKKKY